jgi:hypothetical protein
MAYMTHLTPEATTAAPNSNLANNSFMINKYCPVGFNASYLSHTTSLPVSTPTSFYIHAGSSVSVCAQ